MNVDSQQDRDEVEYAGEDREETATGSHDESAVELIDEDLETQGALMRVLLIEHPTQMTVAELERELFQSEGEHEVEIEDAVARLVAVGLVHRHGQFVIPSRAALYYDNLNFD